MTAVGGRGRSPAVALGCGWFHGPAGAAGGEEGQAAMGTQTLIWARAVSGVGAARRGKLSRALVVRSRWRSMSTRRRARLARALSRFAVIAEAGRLAVAVPARVVVMTARRAAVNEISRGWTGRPAVAAEVAGAAPAAAPLVRVAPWSDGGAAGGPGGQGLRLRRAGMRGRERV